MNETKAIALCIEHHDSSGFDFLVKRYREQAYRHAFGFLGNHEDAADACQDAFKKAFLSITRLERLEQFYPWFYCILRNHCFNMLNRKQTSRHYRESVRLELPSDSSSSPRGELEGAEENALIQDVLSQLKPEFREILVLKYFSDFNYQQLSDTLNIPRGTVMSRLYHARTAFKQAIESLEQ